MVDDLDARYAQAELEEAKANAERRVKKARPVQMRLVRDKALILIGFWRGFRSDELCNIHVENVTIKPGVGMDIYLPHTKTDRKGEGTEFAAPALSRLCPVDAYLEWIHLAFLKEGPVFSPINRWGQVGEAALKPGSITPILRGRIKDAGLDSPELFSGHSFRRGFATWANDSQWDLKSLMEHVGWKDVRSAMRYIKSNDPYAQRRIEAALANTSRPKALPLDQ